MKVIVLKQARIETMKIIEAIRQMGGEETILKLAGYILTAEKKPA